MSNCITVAAADAYVSEARVRSNYGTSRTLLVDGDSGEAYESYLRFTVAGLSGPVQRATLRLYIMRAGWRGHGQRRNGRTCIQEIVSCRYLTFQAMRTILRPNSRIPPESTEHRTSDVRRGRRTGGLDRVCPFSQQAIPRQRHG
jgi:hypothetical protein